MKKVIILLKFPNKITGLQCLIHDLTKHNIAVEDSLSKNWKEQGEDILLITDYKAVIREAFAAGITCVGFEAPDSKEHISGTDMVIQGFEEIDTEFLQLVYKHSHSLPWIIEETEQLIVRETILEDFEALYEIYQEEGMTGCMPDIGDKEEARQAMELYIKHMYKFFQYGFWTVIESKSGQIVGRVGLNNQSYEGKIVVELGYMIGTAYQRKGYGTEAAKAAIEYAFRVVGVKELYVFIHKYNEVSYTFALNLGFEDTAARNIQNTVQVLKRCR